jgi:hypothetical protein
MQVAPTRQNMKKNSSNASTIIHGIQYTTLVPIIKFTYGVTRNSSPKLLVTCCYHGQREKGAQVSMNHDERTTRTIPRFAMLTETQQF